MSVLRQAMERNMRAEKPGVFWRVLLWPLSLVYGAAVAVRAALYGSGLLRPTGLSCRVISVGNITAGGTGKTPVTMLLASFLRSKGRRAVILSRGYRRKGSGVALVSDLDKILLSPEEAGDEPYLMALRLPGVPVVVAADRVEGGRYAIEKFRPDFIILDDGFQHMRLKRDLNILLVDGQEGFGNGYLLPRGVLREPVGGIRRADAVFVKGKRLKDSAADLLKEKSIPSLSFTYNATSVYVLETGERVPAVSLKGKTFVAIAGLAKPESFFSTLEELGVVTAKSLAFPDHHSYTQHDLELIKKEAGPHGAVITTEKDGVKLKGALKGLTVYCVAVEAVFEGKDRAYFEDLFAPLIKEGA